MSGSDGEPQHARCELCGARGAAVKSYKRRKLCLTTCWPAVKCQKRLVGRGQENKMDALITSNFDRWKEIMMKLVGPRSSSSRQEVQDDMEDRPSPKSVAKKCLLSHAVHLHTASKAGTADSCYVRSNSHSNNNANQHVCIVVGTVEAIVVASSLILSCRTLCTLFCLL